MRIPHAPLVPAALCCLLPALSAVAGDAAAPSPGGGTPGAPAGCPTVRIDGEIDDWARWDVSFDRRVVMGRLQGKELENPLNARYDALWRYDAGPDSLGLAAFCDLPAAERRRRAELARDALEPLLKFRSAVKKSIHLKLEVTSRQRKVPRGEEHIPRSLHALVNACGLDPSDPLTAYLLAYFGETVGDVGRAEEHYRRAWDLLAALAAPELADLQFRVAMDQAWLYRQQGLWEPALDAVARARGLDPGSYEAAVVAGLVAAGQGRFDEAWRLSRDLPLGRARRTGPYSASIIKSRYTSPSDFAIRWIQAMAHAARGEISYALHALGEVDEEAVYPFARHFWADVCLLHELDGDAEAFVANSIRAAAYRPWYDLFPNAVAAGEPVVHGCEDVGAPYYLGFGRFYLAGSLFSYGAQFLAQLESEREPVRRVQLADLAERALGTCARRQVRPHEALALRGRLRYGLGRLDEAAADLAAAVAGLEEAGGCDAGTYEMAGLALFHAGRHGDALAPLRAAVARDERRTVAWQALGVCSVVTGDSLGARSAFDRLIAMAPRSGTGWYNRGLLNFNEERYEAALADLRRAAELLPDNADIPDLIQRAQLLQRRKAEPGSP